MQQGKDEARPFPDNKATSRAKYRRHRNIPDGEYQRHATQANVTGTFNTTTGCSENRNATDNTTRSRAWVGAEANRDVALALWLSQRSRTSSPTVFAPPNEEIAANGHVGDDALNMAMPVSRRGATNDLTSFRQVKYDNDDNDDDDIGGDGERVRYDQHQNSAAPCSTTTSAEAEEKNADRASKSSLNFFRERLQRRLDVISLERFTGTSATRTTREKMGRTPAQKEDMMPTSAGSNPCVILEDVGMGESVALPAKDGISTKSEGASTSSNISIDPGPKNTGSARSMDLSTGSRDTTTMIGSKSATSGFFQSYDDMQRSPTGERHSATNVTFPSRSHHKWEWEKVTVAWKKTGLVQN